MNLKDIPYYMKRQTELEDAYRQYSDIVDINKLGIFIMNPINQSNLLAKRVRYGLTSLPIQLELVEESDPKRLYEHIARSSNDLNLVLVEQLHNKAFEKAFEKAHHGSPIENLHKTVWKNTTGKF
jgi:hypothetical protein